MTENHYKYTENLQLWVDVNKKTIRVVGSFKYEYLQEAVPIMVEYEGYELILNDSNDDLAR